MVQVSFQTFLKNMGSSVPTVIVVFGVDLKKSVFLLAQGTAHPCTENLNVVNSFQLFKLITAWGFV